MLNAISARERLEQNKLIDVNSAKDMILKLYMCLGRTCGKNILKVLFFLNNWIHVYLVLYWYEMKSSMI